MQCKPLEKKMKSASGGNKTTNANVSVSRGKYQVFDLGVAFLHSVGDQCNAPSTDFCDYVKVIFCSKSEGGADAIAGEHTWTN